MTAVTNTDLENAKQDVDHIADIANSLELTATDRLGNTKQTMTGLLADLNAAAAVSQTQENRAAAEAARVAAETASDAALAAQLIYASAAAGDSATTAGQYYYVVSSSSVNTLELWLHNGSGGSDTGKRFAAADAFKGIVETTGTTDLLTTRTTVSAGRIQVPAAPTTKPAYLETISVRFTTANAPAYISVYVFEFISGVQYQVTKEYRFVVTPGVTTFTAGVDFDPYLLPVGSLIGAKVLTGGQTNIDSRSETAAGNCKVFNSADVTGVGTTPSLNTVDLTSTQFLPMISYTTVHFDKIFQDNFASIIPDVMADNLASKTGVAMTIRGKTSINRTFFRGTATPSGWNLGGGTVNDGVTFATPGNSAFARYDTNASLNYGGAAAKFTVTDTAAKFGIGFAPQGSDAGGYVEIDGTANTLTFMQWVAIGSAPASLAAFGKQVSIPALVSGRSYTLTCRRRGLANEAVLIDSVTQEAITLASPYTASTHDQFNGKAGFLHRAGSANGVNCTYFERFAMFEKPKIIVLGDSNAWAGSIGPNFSQNKPLEWKQAWPYLLDAARGRGDVLNASRPGENSTGLASRLTLDLNLWSPDFVVLPIGTNDSVQATWRTNMQTVINAVLARGATPVMCTLPPRTTSQTFINALNVDILANFFGDYPILDMAWAVSASNDRVTWNASFDVGDHVHMNVGGHAAVYNQLKIDAPFLLVD